MKYISGWNPRIFSLFTVIVLMFSGFLVLMNTNEKIEAGGMKEDPDETEENSLQINFDDPEYEIKANQYSLPLNDNNYVYAPYILNERQLEYIDEHGYVNAGGSGLTNLSGLYDYLYGRNHNIYITTDSILHIFHILFDFILTQVEELYLYDLLLNMTLALENSFSEMYSTLSGSFFFNHIYESNSSMGWKSYNITEKIDLKEIARKNLAYVSVALKLLDPDASVDSSVSVDVGEELDLIEDQGGFNCSPIFNKAGILEYKEDYSQYKPRGHYTRSEILEKFFQAMMWYGRMTFRTKSGEETVQAILLSDALMKSSWNQRSAYNMWCDIFNTISFFIGDTDDLTPLDYNYLTSFVFGNLTSSYKEILNAAKLKMYMDLLDIMRKPRICSDLVYCDLEGMENATMGMRLLGQRFCIDSYAFQELVFPRVEDYYGDDDPFSLTYVWNFGYNKGFPRGVEAMAMLGSEMAQDYIIEGGDHEYIGYSDQFSKVRSEFESINKTTWGSSLYYGWLYSLKPLAQNFSAKQFPTYMGDRGYQAQKLNTMLGSWTELRHDTLLYVKPSTAGSGIGVHRQKGYVEPIPEFYSRIAQLLNATMTGLNCMGMMPSSMKQNFVTFESTLDRLENLSVKELVSVELNEDDHKFIRDFRIALNHVLKGIPSLRWDSRLVADVHTDPNSGYCLEEATGFFDYIVVAVDTGSGDIEYYSGPVFSYYEFKWPMTGRLNDEEWRAILANNTDVPEKFNWMEYPNSTGGINKTIRISDISVHASGISYKIPLETYNGTVTLTAEVKNVGSEEIPFEIELLRYDGNKFILIDTNEEYLENRTSKIVEFQWNALTTRTREHLFKVELIVDPYLDFSDSNNQATKTIDFSFIPDADWDGFLNSKDDFPNDPWASRDSDGDGYPDCWNKYLDPNLPRTNLSLDLFPDDPDEWSDSDGDGIGDNSDQFPDNPDEWNDTDGDGYGDNIDVFPCNQFEWSDRDNDGQGDNRDEFPDDPNEWKDSDGDGYGDNSDAFPVNNLEWTDSDGDGHGDNSDMFPYDLSEWIDSDRDGYGDNSDAFPDDSCEWFDTDNDGFGNNEDVFPFDSKDWSDVDGDGYGDNTDAFPADPLEWMDSDGDSVGDNSDLFPYNSKDHMDSDGDGIGDNSDAFPDDPDEWIDTDGDGVGDDSDLFPKNPTEWRDIDGDGVGDNSDAFPTDGAASIDSDEDGYPDKWNLGKNERSSTTGLALDQYPDDPDRHEIQMDNGNNDISSLLAIISTVIILILLVLAFFMVMQSNKKCRRSKLHRK